LARKRLNQNEFTRPRDVSAQRTIAAITVRARRSRQRWRWSATRRLSSTLKIPASIPTPLPRCRSAVSKRTTCAGTPCHCGELSAANIAPIGSSSKELAIASYLLVVPKPPRPVRRYTAAQVRENGRNKNDGDARVHRRCLTTIARWLCVVQGAGRISKSNQMSPPDLRLLPHPAGGRSTGWCRTAPEAGRRHRSGSARHGQNGGRAGNPTARARIARGRRRPKASVRLQRRSASRTGRSWPIPSSR
jgi:hypothetical protein